MPLQQAEVAALDFWVAMGVTARLRRWSMPSAVKRPEFCHSPKYLAVDPAVQVTEALPARPGTLVRHSRLIVSAHSLLPLKRGAALVETEPLMQMAVTALTRR